MHRTSVLLSWTLYIFVLANRINAQNTLNPSQTTCPIRIRKSVCRAPRLKSANLMPRGRSHPSGGASPCFFTEMKKTCIRLDTGFQNMVEVTGFEPAASSSRTKRSTKLSHTSKSLSSNRSFVTAFIVYRSSGALSTPFFLFLKFFRSVHKSACGSPYHVVPRSH